MKIIIPAILTATVLIAGFFAFMPVEKASTVHVSIGQSQLLALTATGVTPGTAATDTATWTIGQPFCVVAASFTPTVDAGGDLDLAAPTITTNLHAAGNTATTNPGVIAVGTPQNIIPKTAANAERICGTTTLVIATSADAGAAATDAVTLNVIVQTQSAATAPAAVLS